jgi:hypothetical protein
MSHVPESNHCLEHLQLKLKRRSGVFGSSQQNCENTVTGADNDDDDALSNLMVAPVLLTTREK